MIYQSGNKINYDGYTVEFIKPSNSNEWYAYVYGVASGILTITAPTFEDAVNKTQDYIDNLSQWIKR
jgi:hypothetical protein